MGQVFLGSEVILPEHRRQSPRQQLEARNVSKVDGI
jgi:hypothetical protein